MSSGRFEALDDSADDLDASYQRWIYKQLEKRVVEYSHVDKVTIMCATWNVNAKSPAESENLKEWLLPENTAAPDIYAISLQEIVDLNVINIMMKSSTSVETAAAWVHRFSKTLNSLDYYKVLLDKSMVGILSVIFVKASLHGCIRDVKYALTYTGNYGTTGNKGGIAISMRIHDSPVCFVAAHFHANRDNVAQRNMDYQLICDNREFVSVGPQQSHNQGTLFLFPQASDTALVESGWDPQMPQNVGPQSTRGRLNSAPEVGTTTGATLGASTMNPAFAHSSRRASVGAVTTSNPIAAANAAAASAAAASTTTATIQGTLAAAKKPALKVLDHEYVFWMGDLNYRLEEDIDLVEIFERLYNETWESLRGADQLQLERAKQNIFHGFNEGMLSFPPTYKYQPGTDSYEQRPDKKLRAPAWCDRVLWRSARVDRDVTMLHYRAAPLHMSDHKPVSAMFICNTRKIVKDKLHEVYTDLLQTVDKWVNASKPKLDVSNSVLDFGPLMHNKMYRASITLRNTGSVMAEYRFVPKHGEQDICKSWLKFSPLEGVLAPEEQCEVEVLVILSLEEAYEIATTRANIVEDIAILHVTNGNDHFCMVNGALTADSCAAVCSAYARLGARRSDAVLSVSGENSPSRPASLQTVPSLAGSQRASQRLTPLEK